MPNRFLTYLGCTFGSLVAVYVALVVTTIFLASAQTDLLASVADKEASIGTLESQYYATVVTLDATDPATLGLVAPKDKTFAHAAVAAVLTEAGN